MYKFAPILKTMVWGTESWVLSGVPGSESVVSEGPDAGRGLNDIWAACMAPASAGSPAASGSLNRGTRLPGSPGGTGALNRGTMPPGSPGDTGAEFPLLIKFIDAKRDLSIQVHPDDELAMRRHGCNGKSEMWYIIGAEKDAHLLCGLKEKISPEEYARLVEEDRITEVLCDYKVAPGDVFYLPAGRIHAICGGCYLAEIQQTSDITYRIYDYGRPGLDGKPRQLHTELAKEAIDYSVLPDYRTSYAPVEEGTSELVRCPHFTTSLHRYSRPATLSAEGCGDFLIVIGLEGEALLRPCGPGTMAPSQALPGGQTDRSALTLRPGEAVLVPTADAPLEIIPTGTAPRVTLLTTHL